MNKKNAAAIKKYKNYFDTLAHEKAKLQTLTQKTRYSNKPSLFDYSNPEGKQEERIDKFLEKYMYQGDIQFGKTTELPFLQNSNDLFNKLVLKNEFTNKTDNTDVDIFDINDIYNRNIKTIINVYQEQYKNGIYATGLGDFIRGCYYLINFGETYKVDYKIMINHKMKAYLKKYEDQPMYENWKGIEFFSQNNYEGQQIDANKVIHNLPGKIINSKFVKHIIENVKVIDEAVYIYNIIFPNHDICEYHKEHMRGILEPTEYMANLIEKTMNNLSLTNNNFTVIHIRSGDKYLKDMSTDFSPNYITRLNKEIFYTINQNKQPITSCLVLTDNMELKHIIAKTFPAIKILLNPIAHLGQGVVQHDEAIKNTLLEFYLMSRAASIVSFSSYEHGSGFSQWCAKTYNIPYVCKLITPF
jgi:hypothetical protein